MFETQYKELIKNKSHWEKIKKILKETNPEYGMSPGFQITHIDPDIFPDEVKHEAVLITEEMALTTVFKNIQKLDPIDAYIVRHSFGLPKDYSGNSYYQVKTRKEIAKELELEARDIIWIRHEAVQKLFSMLLGGESVEGR